MKSFGHFFNQNYLISENIEELNTFITNNIVNKNIKNICKKLTPIEELDLINIYRSNPFNIDGISARNKIILNNVDLIHSMLKPLNINNQVEYIEKLKCVIQYLINALSKCNLNTQKKSIQDYIKILINQSINDPYVLICEEEILNNSDNLFNQSNTNTDDIKIKQMIQQFINDEDNLQENQIKILNIYFEIQNSNSENFNTPNNSNREQAIDKICKDLKIDPRTAELNLNRVLNKLKKFAVEKNLVS